MPATLRWRARDIISSPMIAFPSTPPASTITSPGFAASSALCQQVAPAFTV
jgi:hypothetical protein